MPSNSSSYFISFCPFSICFSLRYLLVNNAVLVPTTIEVDTATPVAAVVRVGSIAMLTTHTARAVPPKPMVMKETSRVIPPLWNQMSKNCGRSALVFGSLMSSTTRRTKT